MSDEPHVPDRVIAGDIGGTHARLAVAREDSGAIALEAARVLNVRDHAGMGEALAEYLRGIPPPHPTRACLAWAGPIDGATAQLTNGAWRVEAATLAKHTGLAHIALINDFHAAAAGVGCIAEHDLAALQPGVPVPGGARLVIGAGTGLGVAYAIRDAHGTRIVAGEGGHVAFGPLDDEQDALLAHCRRELGRVTAEHLVSGSGIVRLYGFCCAQSGHDVPDDVRSGGAAAVVQRAEADEAAAQRALRLFCAIFGAVAGDHALACLATGGVYVAGGIAAKLGARMADGTFRAAFAAKGVHAALAARMPIWLVLDDALGLRGAASLAFAAARSA